MPSLSRTTLLIGCGVNLPTAPISSGIRTALHVAPLSGDVMYWNGGPPSSRGDPKKNHIVPRSFQNTGAASAASAKSGHGSGMSQSSVPYRSRIVRMRLVRIVLFLRRVVVGRHQVAVAQTATAEL